MAQPVQTRKLKRRESGGAARFVALALVAVLFAFAAGFWFGRQQGITTEIVVAPPVPSAVQVNVPPRPALEETTAPENLSFYDNLPKGEQAPLGSGINQPLEPVTDKLPVVEKTESVATAPVATAPSPVETAHAARPDPAGAFLVQVASFQAEPDADRLVNRLQKRGIVAVIERADLGGKGVWYRVVAGPYTERTEAEQVSVRLRNEERLSALVRRR
ncbi:MAG: SPOR domain-containing protein [Desulfuromonadales bacterium]|nr:SPOR domain-containing protein [Desulfuromonadales bacterium]